MVLLVSSRFADVLADDEYFCEFRDSRRHQCLLCTYLENVKNDRRRHQYRNATETRGRHQYCNATETRGRHQYCNATETRGRHQYCNATETRGRHQYCNTTKKYKSEKSSERRHMRCYSCYVVDIILLTGYK